MAYYVVDHMGQKFGPADIDVLNQWIAEGRLLPHMMLEDDRFGGQIVASSVPGLNFAASSNPYNHYAQPPVQSFNYPRTGFAMADAGQPQRDAIAAIACAVLAPFALMAFGFGCILLSGFAIRFGSRAHRAGNKLGIVGIVLGIVMIGVWFFWRLRR